MLIRILLTVVFVICSRNILESSCNDDEFAEFDDFPPIETNQDSPQLARDQHEENPLPKAKLNVEHDDVRRDPILSHDKQIDEIEDNAQPDKAQKKPDLKLVNAPLPKFYSIESYYVEIAFLIASVLYFLNYFIGSSKNSNLAQNWYEQTRDKLKPQFALVGGSQILDNVPKTNENESISNASSKKQKGLIKSSDSVFTIWNSGRIGLDGLLIELNLLKRQDIFSMALTLIKTTQDNLNLHFLLSQTGYENFVFCLANKTVAAKLARDMVDINTFCPKRKPLSQYGHNIDRLFVMSELNDVASFILDRETISFLGKYERSINYIHITDKYSTLNSDDLQPAQRLDKARRMARFSFAFPKRTEDSFEFIFFALSLLDRLRRFKLAKDSKLKSERNRNKVTDIIQKTQFTQRQEAAQAKKEEERRKEKERIYNEDDPEKQRRWEKKEAKRELKKNKMRVKQMKVKTM